MTEKKTRARKTKSKDIVEAKLEKIPETESGILEINEQVVKQETKKEELNGG